MVNRFQAPKPPIRHKTDWRFLFVVAALIWIGWNAQEAHRHSHEAACAAGHAPTCEFVDLE